VGGYNGRSLLLGGMVVAALGIVFGLVSLRQVKNLPVHRSMLEISDLIYETCKTYLITQGKFILILWAFIAVIIAGYYGWLNPIPGKSVATTLPKPAGPVRPVVRAPKPKGPPPAGPGPTPKPVSDIGF